MIVKRKNVNKKKKKRAAPYTANKTQKAVDEVSAQLKQLQLELKKDVADRKPLKPKISNAYEALLLSIAMPKEFPPLRLGAGLASYQTAVANPFEVVKPGFGAIASGVSTADLTCAFCFRDPYRFLVTWISHPAPADWEYRGSSTFAQVSGQFMALQFPPLAWFSGVKAHGDAIFPGRLDGNRRNYIWLEQGQTITFTSLAVNAVTLAPYRYDTDGTTNGLAGFGLAGGGTQVFAASVEGYYAFDVNAALITGFSCNITVQSNGTPGTWGHRSIPFGYQNGPSMDAVKMYAVSLMYTNTAAPIYRQGKLTAVQIPRRRDWRDFTSYDAVASVKDAYIDAAVDGYYGFLKPTQFEDLNFKDQNEIEAGRLEYAYFNLEANSDYLGLAISITTPEGRDGYLTICSALEYRTNDQFREVRFPDVTSSVVSTAMNLACRLPQHHENPFHMSDIFDWIKETASNIWEGFKTALPKVVDTAEKVARIGGAVIPLL